MMKSEYYEESLNREQVVKISRLSDCENFICERKKFVFNMFVNFQPVERFDNRRCEKI